MTNTSILKRKALRGGAALQALALLGAGLVVATPAFAQTTPAPSAPASQTTEDDTTQDVVVTGSIFRRTDTETPSPVTVLTAEALDQRGITTAQEGVQRLSANNAGALPNNFTAAGAFAAGASAVSLRGLTTSSTLVLFDGLRGAYYPLADDGTRNFVDLNTISDAIIERIEVLKDGASSTYGADAVAGVVNIITKKQFKGLAGRVEAGVTQRGDGGHQRASLTGGYGDLESQGFNVYASVEYQKDDAIRSSGRGYPYNTADLSKLCLAGGTTLQCRANGIQNGINADGSYQGLGTTQIAVVRPYNAANTVAAVGSRYQLLNPGLGCGVLPTVTLNAAQAASTTGITAPITNCQEDLRQEFNLISPEDERIGGSIRGTVKLGDNIEAYAMGNYYRNKVNTTGAPSALRATTTPGASGLTATTATLALPVFICAAGVNCTAANGTLNPQNPFAASNQVARIVGRLNYQTSNEYLTQAYRGAAGINGSFGDDWTFSVDGTYMRETLDSTYKGFIFVQNLLTAVGAGTYNFVNQAANTQAQRDFVTPTQRNRSVSELYQIQGNVTKALFDLPGGPLMLGVGASYRHELVNSPSANTDVNGPANRYFTINGFGSAGSRGVRSAFFELQAPILDQLEVNASGRYDDYTSGQHNFSPKLGAKFTPIREIALRGTYSRGFRIPSFAESGALPTTGFITVTPSAAFCAAGNRTSYACDPYSLGLTAVGTPGLKPEKSRNFTGGVIIEPKSWLSFTVDYFNIKKTNLIAGANYAPAIAAFYAGTTAPGLTTTPDVADAQNPNGARRLGFIGYGFQNADSLKVSGIDFTGQARIPLSGDLRFTSSLDVSYVMKYTTTFADGSGTQRYDGTLGPYQITSASGTPKWRGNWSNTLSLIDRASLTLTGYYTSGYGEEAEDAGGIRGDCLGSIGAPITAYRDGVTPVACSVKRFIYFDLNTSIDVAKDFTFYANVYNLFGARAPYDPTTYGGYQYNPAWASSGIVGRAFNVGAKVNF